MDKVAWEIMIVMGIDGQKLPEWLNQFLNTDKPCELLLCRLIDTSDHSVGPEIDQTLPTDGAEVFIEFVLRRR